MNTSVATGAMLGNRQVSVRWAPGVGQPLWIECDRLWCVEIFANLISNAHKYSPPGTPIEITVDSVDGNLACSVCDSGPGISEEKLPRLFEPFYRGLGSTHSDGIGLGLPIARAMARWHGGQLTAANRAEGGACFTVQLPLQQPAT